MKWLLQITSLLIFFAVTSGKNIEVPSSRLILEYNWPEPKKNIERYPHAKSCSHFYVNKPDGSQSLKKCPENELFDFRSLRCREKILAKCWNDLLKKDHLKKIKKRFSCPFPWGLYPDIEDCSAFYDCLGGRPYLRKCPSSTLFDKAERTCINEKQALCADHSDIVEVDYKCPYKWGYFTYGKDCSKFYECLRKVPSIRSCKKNMLFDNLKRKCMPMSTVDCGERFNPYGKEKEAIEHISTEGEKITTERIPKGGMLETTKLILNREVTTGSISNERDGVTSKLIPTEVRETTKLTSTGEVTTGHVPTEKDGMASKHISSGVRETTQLTSTGEVTTGHVSTEKDGMASKRISSEGVRETTKLMSIEEVATGRVSTERDGITSKRIQTGVRETIKFVSTGEQVTIEFGSTERDEMTSTRIPTGEVRETTKLASTVKDTTGYVSTEKDGMASRGISTEGVRETTKFVSIGEEVMTGRVSTDRDGITSKRFPTNRVRETTKHTSTGEVTTGNVSTERDGMSSKRISTEGVRETTKVDDQTRFN